MSDNSQDIDRLKRALVQLHRMRSKLEAIERSRSEPIAIIGIGCRFPGGSGGPENFWKTLYDGVDAISEVPADRWDVDAYFDPDPEKPGKMYTRYGGFLQEVDKFDPEFFGISPREAVNMDPQQRLLLEVGWEALENAGRAAYKINGNRTGVFVGITSSDYLQHQIRFGDPDCIDAYTITGNALNAAPGRLSFILGLKGPSMAVDTACSSSLVATHLACQSLRSGESDLALAGGVNIILTPETSIALSRMRALASDSHCKTFDAAANGFVRGEGCGVVVLERLSDAVANGDRILALIRGSAVNQDGHTSGFTVPNGLAQQAVIRAGLAAAKVQPNEVSYVEAHGTGTPLGDPIEVEALQAVLCEERSDTQRLAIGSVKTNIGHLEAAAGIAGLIKVVLALLEEKIPPHLHLKQLNPQIRWKEIPLRIPTERTPWPSGNGRRIAGVSSFGASGTNAHMVLEEAPQVAPLRSKAERSMHLLALSAKVAVALRELAERYERHLEARATESLGDVCFTANAGRAHFAHRLALVVESTAQACEKLGAFVAGQQQAGLLMGESTSRPGVAYLFTGQGSQYVGMGRQLYETQPTFRKALERCDALLRPHLETSVLSVLYPEPGMTSPLDQTVYTQPALFAFEYALAELWRSWGIEPTVVMGHSVGEYVAACVAGVFSLEDGLKLIAERGRLMQSIVSEGEMAAVFAAEQRVVEAVAPYGKQVSIAAINAPDNVVISGEREAVVRVCERLEREGISFQPLRVSHAFHSPMMEPILDEFERTAARVAYSSARIGVISNLTGELVEEGAVCDAAYWRRHVREPVRFSTGMQTLFEQGYRLFVEIGPSATLLGLGRRCLSGENCVWFPSFRQGKGEWEQMLESLGGLYVKGVEVDWPGFDRDYARRRVELPTYPFQRKRYWVEYSEAERLKQTRPPLSQDGLSDWLYEIQWQSKKRQQIVEQPQEEQPGCWLIFADSQGVGTAFAQLLEKLGGTCVMVFAGEVYERIGQRHFRINPANPEDFRQLFMNQVRVDGSEYFRTVHLWSLDAGILEETTLSSIEASQVLGSGSVLHLVQSLVETRWPASPRLWLVTRSSQPAGSFATALSAAQAPLWGLGRVIALEHPEVWGGLVDLDFGSTEEQASTLLKEIWKPEAEDQVAFRGGDRYVARLVRSKSLDGPADSLRIRTDGTYLITGGLGALGLRLARWLVDEGARHLVLTGRRGLLERSERSGLTDRESAATNGSATIKALEDIGATVQVVRADVSDLSQMSTVFEQIRSGPFALRGIIHAAGISTQQALVGMELSTLQSVLRPKVTGTWILHQLSKGMELDFLVLFSSAASVWGSKQIGHYAAANHFLDAFAHHRKALGLPALSVNWGPWAAGGMATPESRAWMALRGVEALFPEQALEALKHLLGSRVTQAIVARMDWDQFKPIYELQPRRPLLEQIKTSLRTSVDRVFAPQPEILHRLEKASLTERKELLAAYVREQVAQVLRFDPLQPLELQKGFFQMGMDSLMAIELKNRLEAGLGILLPSTLTFECSNIHALSEYLIARILSLEPSQSVQQSEKETDKRAELLSEVEQLSEERMTAFIAEQFGTLIKGNIDERPI